MLARLNIQTARPAIRRAASRAHRHTVWRTATGMLCVLLAWWQPSPTLSGDGLTGEASTATLQTSAPAAPPRSGGEHPEAPLPSRWIHPDGAPRPRLEPPAAAPALRIHPIHRPPRRHAKRTTATVEDDPAARLALIVDDTLFDALSIPLARYVADLEADGYRVIVQRFIEGSAATLREHLGALYTAPESLTGVQLIGDLPYAVFEMTPDSDWGVETEDFPCDLYYMNLHGVWSDTSGNGKLDTHSGTNSLQIWVSRLKTDNLPALGTAADLINRYLDKNHGYRTGALRPEARALVYNDDAWAGMGEQDRQKIALCYGDEQVMAVTDPDLTTATDYKGNRMPMNLELVLTRSHGWSRGHGYYDGGRFGFVSTRDYRERMPPALFYQLFVCSGSDYTQDDHLAGTIVFKYPDSGLAVWGSSKSGGMWNEQPFYERLADGASIGTAFIDWYNTVKDTASAPRWFFGMTLTGDASLRLSPFQTIRQRSVLLNTASSGAGTATPDHAWISEGTPIDLLATADPYHHFTHWSAVETGEQRFDNPLTLTPNGPATVTAHFAPNLTTNTGTPEVWLARHGYTNFVTDVFRDPFGKGMPLWMEYVAGTDPDNPLDRFTVHIARNTANGSEIVFQGRAGRSYRILHRADLADTEHGWTPLNESADLPGSNAPIRIVDTDPGARRRFYRVRVRLTENNE